MSTSTVLVMGADGLIGSEVVQRLKEKGYPLLLSGRRQNSEENYWRFDLSADVCTVPPGVGHVVFCSSPNYRNSQTELDRFLRGALSFIRELNARDIPILFLSTNHVFDGLQDRPGISCETQPICEYGRHKVLLENEVRSRPHNTVLRLTKVIGPYSSPFKSWIEQLMNGSSIEAFANLWISPISESLVADVVEKILSGKFSGTFHLSASDSVTFADTISQIARSLGLREALIRKVEADAIRFPRVHRHSNLDAGSSFLQLGLSQPLSEESWNKVLTYWKSRPLAQAAGVSL